MPSAPLHPCPKPGCPNMVTHGYCEDHTREGRRRLDSRRPTAKERGYDARWRKLRAYVLASEPVCRICRRAEATEVDHIVPLRAGGTNDFSNLQSICKPCHSAKTATEDGGFGN